MSDTNRRDGMGCDDDGCSGAILIYDSSCLLSSVTRRHRRRLLLYFHFLPLAQVDDTFFAHVIDDRRGRYPDRIAGQEDSAWYSIESLGAAHIEPWFVHKVWAYLPHTRWAPWMARVKQYYPELWKK